MRGRDIVAQRFLQPEPFSSRALGGFTLMCVITLLNQCSPVPRTRGSIAGKDVIARAQIYACLGSKHLVR